MKELVLSESDIKTIVSRIGKQLTEELSKEEKPPVLLGVLRGAMPFYQDLVREIHLNFFCDYISVSSYEGGLSTTGKVHLTKDSSIDMKDRVVVVVEDIVDTGYSMQFLLEHLRKKGPKRIIVCALFDKRKSRVVDVPVDYVGHELKDSKFLVGYGLDYQEMLRNVPYVYVPTEEEIKELDELAKK